MVHVSIDHVCVYVHAHVKYLSLLLFIVGSISLAYSVFRLTEQKIARLHKATADLAGTVQSEEKCTRRQLDV